MIVECVPNFSEGRNAAVLQAIADAITSVSGVALLDQTSDTDHNRSVYTFAGNPAAVADAAFAAVREASQRIDLRLHTGVHPRLGAADVVPFVPVSGISLAETAVIAREVAKRVWTELAIPVYLYEAASLQEPLRRLEDLRKLVPQSLAPDFGLGSHCSAGAVCIGARKFLIAWNINLKTGDLSLAKEIAREIRQSNGGLPAVKALGMKLESRNEVQVSMNLVDFETTPLHEVFEVVATKCRVRDVEIAGSELIGLIPQAALDGTRGYDLRWENMSRERVLENRLRDVGLAS